MASMPSINHGSEVGMGNKKMRVTTIATLGILWLASACASHNSATTGVPRAAKIAPAQRIDGDRATEYTSLANLAKASQAVVVAVAGDQTPSIVHGVPFMTTNMTVKRTMSGTVPHTFRLYQLGANDGSVAPEMIVASSGRTYLLFLTPFETAPGVTVASDLYTTVGAAAGMYQERSTTFEKTDPASPQLPSSVTAISAQTAFRATH